MAGLQTSVGLISGINIKEVVDQLIAIDAIPRDNLKARQEKLQKQQAAYVQLTQLFNTTTYMMRNLSKVELFDRRDVKSSNESVLKAIRTSNPQPGNYVFTPLKLAQAQTTISSGVASDSTPLGKEGEITIKFGRDLTTHYSMADINGGAGFDRGYIRITDATGARANIDLRNALSFDDILEAINNCKDIDVYASMEGDHLLLKDYSGGTGTLRVQEINGGTTARSLGLDGVTEVNGEIRGKNLLWMGSDTALSLLNDGAGIAFDNVLDDLYVTLADGTKITIDFNPLPNATAEDTTQKFMTTVGDLLKTINDAGKVSGTQKLEAKISADGKRIEFIDNTYIPYFRDNAMKIEQNSLTAPIVPLLYQLGLAEWGTGETSVSAKGKISGRAILGDLDSVLLSSLNGGRGFPAASLFDNVAEGDRAILAAQDQAGNYTYITISREEYAAAETLEDLCRMINSKLANATRYEAGSYNRVLQLDEYDQPIPVTYEDGGIKYQLLPGNDKLPWDYDVEKKSISMNLLPDLNGTPPGSHASWIYEDDNPLNDIIGYRNSEGTFHLVFEDDDPTKDILGYKHNGDEFLWIYDADDPTKITGYENADKSKYLHWVYDAADPDKIVGYQTHETSILFVFDEHDPDKITGIRRPGTTTEYAINATYVGHYSGNDRPLLDENGFPVLTTIPQLEEIGDVSTGKNESDDVLEVLRYINGYGEWAGNPLDWQGWQDGITTELTGYELDDGTIVWFQQSEVEFLAEHGVDGTIKKPLLVEGVIKTEESISIYDATGGEKNYLGDPDYAFEVEWEWGPNPLYDSGDPSSEAETIVGYKVKYYDQGVKAETNPTLFAEINALAAAGSLPYVNAAGNMLENRIVQTTDDPAAAFQTLYPGITEPNLLDHGFEWLYEGSNPSNKVVGYRLGDGEARLFISDELDSIANSPDGGKYPILSLTPEYVYQTGVGLELRVNSDGSGLELVDTTGIRNGKILFGDLPGAGGHFAVALGFGGGVEAAATKIIGNSLNVQTISHNTKISDLNGGQGVDMTNLAISIQDTAGKASGTIDLSRCQTIGDVLRTINNSSANVIARINNAGDGITILDLASVANTTTGNLTVSQTGGTANALAGLGLKTGTYNRAEQGTGSLVELSGSTTYTVKVAATDSLDDIRKKINGLGPYFKATVINDGSAKPYRLSISGSATGAAGNMKIDLSAIGLDTSVMTKAQDACLLYGDPDSGASLMLSSKTNTFNNVVPGITFTINGTSTTPVNVWTEDSPADIKNSLRTFVENYNKLKQFLNEHTIIDVNQNVKGILAQDNTLLALQRDMNELLLKTFSNLGPIRTLADVGIKMVSISELLAREDGSSDAENADAETTAMLKAGMLEFDESVFDRLYESNPAAIKEFFTKAQDTLNEKGEVVSRQIGYASMFENIYQVYSYDPETSALNSKYNAFDRQILNNEQRLAFMQERLDVKRILLERKFYAMEQALSKMQSDMSYISNISTSLATTS